MNKACRSIYQFARVHAGFTQEEAAERLHIGVRTLAGYEALSPIPPDQVVCSMVDVYGAEWLAYEHLQKSTELGQKYLPKINLTDLPRSVLTFHKEVSDIKNIDSDMISIACDGRVEKSEVSRWNEVKKEIKDVIAAAFGVIFSKNCNET